MTGIRSPQASPAAAPSSTDLLIVIDPNGRFRGLGPRCPQAFGYSAAELLDQPFLAFVHPDDRPATSEALRKLAQGEPTLGLETRFRCKDDSYRWLAWTAMPTPEGVLYAVARDISARRRPERAEPRMLGSGLDAAVALREDYLASVCHDVQQPLTVVLAQAQLLQRQLARGEELPPQVLETRLAYISSAATRMRSMCQELAEASVKQAGHALVLLLTQTDLVALARQAVAEYELISDKHQLLFAAEVPTLEAAVDETRVHRVLSNLLTNAIKYSPRGGTVLVTVKPDGLSAVLEVHDQGLGILPDDLPRIFDRFHRGTNVIGRFAGMGLGLASAHDLVELHGGTISAHSEYGQGSTFSVRLPLTPPEHATR
jgi:PAS domain S-box-containing protein